MQIESFDDLLNAARNQPIPQHMLFVFLRTRLPKDATDVEKSGFERGEGGAFQPISCVDFPASEVSSFELLTREADKLSEAWDKVLVACIDHSGDSGQRVAIDRALKLMISRVESGADLSGLACFDRQGVPLRFT